MKKGTKKCLLCGESASFSKYDENYLDGFCDLCIMSMKKEQKTQSKSKLESPYDEIINKITIQVEKIETVVSTILDKVDPIPSSPSISSKKSSEPIIIKTKKDGTPSTKPKTDGYAYGSNYTSNQTNDDHSMSNEAKYNDVNAKPKKVKKSKYVPSVTPVDN